MASGLGPLVSAVLFTLLGNRWEVSLAHETGLHSHTIIYHLLNKKMSWSLLTQTIVVLSALRTDQSSQTRLKLLAPHTV